MSRITFTDVRSEAIEAIRLLKEGKIDVKQAQEIRGLLNTVIDTAKTEVEFLKAIPDHVKEQMTENKIRAIAATVEDKDLAIDESVNDIEYRRNHYVPGEN